MATRIRYGKAVEGIITSTQFYTAEGGGRYQVKIVTNSNKDKHFTWRVLEDITNHLAGEGVAVNLHRAKIKAKEKLEELGISFDKETREEKPVVAEVSE